MDWNDVRHFLALARLGSARAAGVELGVSHSTVVRRVEALEARLATRLFDRSRDGYALTDAGERMLVGAERIEAEMAAIERGVVGQDERLAGYASITCSDNYMAGLIVEALPRLIAAHPEIEVGITTDNRSYDLSRREADVAIRVLTPDKDPPEHLIGRKLAPLTIASYVAVAHAERLDPERPGARPRWIAFDERATSRHLCETSSYPDLPLWGGVNSIALMVSSALAGLGLVFLPTYVGDRVTQLRRLAKPDLRHMADVWLLSHPDLRSNARLRVTRRFLVDTFERHRALFGGDPK